MPRILVLFSGIEMLGSERANLEVVAALKAEGSDVRLIVSSQWWGQKMRDVLSERSIDFATAPFILIEQEKSLSGHVMNVFRVLVGSVLVWWQIIRYRPTHLFCGNQHPILSFLPAMLLTRVPLIYRCGDAPILHNRLYRFAWRLICRRSRHVMVVSHYIKNQLIAAGMSEDIIEVIYSKPPTRDLQRTDFEAEKKDGLCVVFVGQIRYEKGIGMLVEAVQELAKSNPIHLLIAGRISDWQGDDWARQLHEGAGSSSEISFLGYVEDVPGLLAHADVVVVPTLTQEPLANVVLEAKQAATPAVVFPSGGLPEVVEHGKDGFICEGSSAADLVTALTPYVKDANLAKQHGVQARNSLSSFGIDNFSSRWNSVFAEV